MKFLLLFCTCFSLFGAVENSIIPSMDQLMITDLSGKIQKVQEDKILAATRYVGQCKRIPNLGCPPQPKTDSSGCLCIDQKLRIMSFNMLLNWSESHLEAADRWENRKDRIIEYILWANPDVIGSQELQPDQLGYVLAEIGADYDYYGLCASTNDVNKEIPAIFYRKSRLELIKGKSKLLSDKNLLSVCHFKDKLTSDEFIVMNTHLAYGNIDKRYRESLKLRDEIKRKAYKFPVFVTGDFNTFPFRQELELPFYDGETIIKVIEAGGVKDSMKLAIFGHFGPISTTNFCAEKKAPFCSDGEPGVILDHIFTNASYILCHGIDPAKVNGRYPSDHFPVFIDVLPGL